MTNGPRLRLAGDDVLLVIKALDEHQVEQCDRAHPLIDRLKAAWLTWHRQDDPHCTCNDCIQYTAETHSDERR